MNRPLQVEPTEGKRLGGVIQERREDVVQRQRGLDPQGFAGCGKGLGF